MHITKNNSKVLVVRDVLELCNDDATGFLIIEFVGFTGSKFGVQSIGHSVMFTQPNGVHDYQQWMFTNSIVTYFSNKIRTFIAKTFHTFLVCFFWEKERGNEILKY